MGSYGGFEMMRTPWSPVLHNLCAPRTQQQYGVGDVMSDIRKIFEAMPSRFNPGRLTEPKTYYFSVGDEKWTVWVDSEACRVEFGRKVSNADCVLKCDPGLFSKMVLKGKNPGPIDVARGRIKTNDVTLLKMLPEIFRMG